MPRDWNRPYRRKLARQRSERGRRMARVRWDRYHAEQVHESEPKMQRYYPIQFGFRDTRSGEEAWEEFRSVRQLLRVGSLIQRDWQPAFSHPA